MDLSPPSPPILGGTRVFESLSPPELGDLGGRSLLVDIVNRPPSPQFWGEQEFLNLQVPQNWGFRGQIPSAFNQTFIQDSY